MDLTTGLRMMITKLPFGQPGRIFRSSMPFGKYDPEGLIYKAYREHAISVIVLLAGDHECKVKAGKDLKALYTQDGFTVVHLPIKDFGIPKPENIRLALDATVRETQSGRHVVIHCSAGIGRTGLFTACLAKRLLNLPGEQAIEWVRQHIPHGVETPEQRRFVMKKRSSGALVNICEEVYAISWMCVTLLLGKPKSGDFISKWKCSAAECKSVTEMVLTLFLCLRIA